MNVRVRIVYGMVVVIVLLSGVACQSDGDDNTPSPTEVAVVEAAEATVESESTTMPESLSSIVAQVATTVPTSRPTETARPTRTTAPTNAPGASEADTDTDTVADETELTPTERAYTVRTEVPTATPAIATSTPTVGDVLFLPTPRIYIVREGDTIKSIAYFCEVTITDLLAENDIAVEEADKIIPGQLLQIPEAN